RVAVSESEVRALSVRGSRIQGLEFLFGSIAGMDLEGLTGGPLVLCDLSFQAVKLASCRLIGLTLSGARGDGFTFEKCPTLRMLMVSGSELRGLRFSECTLRGPSLRESVLAGTRFERCALAGLDLEESRLDGLVVSDTELDEVLDGAASSLRGLVLERVRYGARYRLHDDGASYEGNRFERR
ncbi:MAG TPA: pentapeptide repeat-containing protein, partial [Anaeromyxobacteraceae bacterium]|nr:pentapeptide repeat-containing protein [Anaeromyxobacteraceae bacterium]